MRLTLGAVLSSALLSGCATPHFYQNDVLEASAVSRAVTAQKIDAQNGVFAIYKVNGVNYALVTSAYQSSDMLLDVDGAMILGEKEAEALRETCRQIVEAYGKAGGNDLKVIEYHLVEKTVQMQSLTSAFAYQGLASATTQSGLYQNVPFRLQYTYQPGALFGSGEKIIYSAGGTVNELKIDQVKALLADLQK